MKLRNIKLFILIYTQKLWMRSYTGNRKKSVFLLLLKEFRSYISNIFKGSYLITFNKKYAQSYFNYSNRKSSLSIFKDNILWAIRKNETNYFYYAYGLDQKKAKIDNYIARSEFKVYRNILNIKLRENLDAEGYNFNYLLITHDKFIFGKFCDSLGIPSPKVFGIINYNKIWWIGFGKGEYEALESLLSFSKLDAFVKEISGELGKWSFILQVIKPGFFLINGNESNIEELKRLISKGRYLIQERIIQHHKLALINPYSVNTIRMETYLDNEGNVTILDALIRFGTQKRIVDNWGQGGFCANIDLETGIINNIGYYKPGFGTIVKEKHPDSNENFAGITIPHFRLAVNMAKKLHKAIYGLPSMGWDIAITEEGPVFLEAGEDWEITLVQMCRPDFKSEFLKYHKCALDIPLKDIFN